MSFPKRAYRRAVERFCLLLLVLSFAYPFQLLAQNTGSLHGQLLDPSGAVVPGATVTLTQGPKVLTAQSSHDGSYSFTAVPFGAYTLAVDAEGFAHFSRANVLVLSDRAQLINATLSIAVQQQDMAVTGEHEGVSLSPDENSNAIIIKDRDLDALSDDPDELQNQLQALAGPAAGPNGGQIYIDGFTGGQLPPKSSIREIRVNQNPFSAEFDRIGYGRIEILTKPGSDKLKGHLGVFGSTSALNTANPLAKNQPSYYLYFLTGDVNGPLSKTASYFTNAFYFNKQNQNIVNAVNPANTTTTLNVVVPNPTTFFNGSVRTDFQLGKSNTLTVRDSFNRSTQTGAGVGVLSLPAQAFDLDNQENALQLGNTTVVNSHLINETRFQWRRIRNNQVADLSTPTVTVQGAFTDGGNNSGVVRDHQDIFELQNYSTATTGTHTMRFGTRLRAYRTANYSTSGDNGNYIFQSLSQYEAGTPQRYQLTLINNPLARALIFDGALFFQDDWRWKPNLTLSYGLRFEGQNYISDHADWAPRVSLAWAPGHPGKTPPKTVFRDGYGWFYNRFTVPNSFSSSTGTPYIIRTIHQNGINQQSFVVDNPDFFNPTAPPPPPGQVGTSSTLPTISTIDQHFRAALDMQGGVGVDRQISKQVTLNATYLFTRGIHQYLSNNITAPEFDPTTYTIVGTMPDYYNFQFQSGGIYSQHQIIVSTSVRLKHLSLNSNYTFNEAKSDTQGVTWFPSVAQNPRLDYGRANFGIRSRFFLLASYSAPHGIVVAPLLAAQSGTPYNITIGNDLTANNQFNARPTYGTCGATNVVSTPFGCLNSNPVGAGEKIIPYNLGTGPANVVFHIRVSKVFGIGPKIEGASGANGPQTNTNVSGRGLSGGQAQVRIDATVPRRYSLTIVGAALNVFNIVNLGTPNGVMNSSLFGQTQSLAYGPYGSPTPGNRTIFFQALFSF